MSVTRGTLAEALDMIDLQLAADSDEVVLPRDAAELVACALHDLLGQPRKIAAAREDVPALVAEIERLTGEPTEDEVERAAKALNPDAWGMDPYDYLDSYQRVLDTNDGPRFQKRARDDARRNARAALRAARGLS